MRPVIHVFHPSEIPHPWRGAWALFAVSVWAMVALYYLVMGFGWLVTRGGWDWGVGMNG